MCKCSHRSIELLGDGLVAFTFNMLVNSYRSHLLRGSLVSFLWSILSVGPTMIPNSRVTAFNPLKWQIDC